MPRTVASPNEISVEQYVDARRHEVLALLAEEYGGDENARSSRFSQFYEHSYQADYAIRLIATHNGQVAGFQSLFRWPYDWNGQTLNTLQSGNSIIATEWRGKGVFGRLLRKVDEVVASTNVDALVGFPVAASLGSFVRNGWLHLGDLSWYARPISPLSLLRPSAQGKLFNSRSYPVPETDRYRAVYSLSCNPDFRLWREVLLTTNAHCCFTYEEADARVSFDLRLEQRGRLKLLVIGGIAARSFEKALLKRAFGALIKAARRTGRISAILFAYNEACDGGNLKEVLPSCLFFKLKRKIHFIVKPVAYAEKELLDFANWRLFRHDIDTW